MRRPAPASLRKRNPATVARARRPAAAGRPAPSRRRGYDASPAIATAPACPKDATQQFQPFRPLGAYVNGRAFLHCDQGGGAVPRRGRENCGRRQKRAAPAGASRRDAAVKPTGPRSGSCRPWTAAMRPAAGPCLSQSERSFGWLRSLASASSNHSADQDRLLAVNDPQKRRFIPERPCQDDRTLYAGDGLFCELRGHWIGNAPGSEAIG